MLNHTSSPARRRAAQSTLVIALGLAVSLTACVSRDSGNQPATPTPTQTQTALYTSDEEALAAAEKVYREYLEVSDAIAREGGIDADRLRPFVTADQYDLDRAFFARLRADEMHFEGGVVLETVELQTATPNEVIIYGCLNVGAARQIDKEGRDVTSPTREERVLVEVALLVERGNLLISGLEPWSTSC